VSTVGDKEKSTVFNATDLASTESIPTNHVLTAMVLESSPVLNAAARDSSS
jgi:hypothetical protein